MADKNENTNENVENTNQEVTTPNKPVFTPEQQEYLDTKVLPARLARQKTEMEATFKTQLETEMEKLRTELKPAKKEGENDAEGQKEEWTRILTDQKTQTENERKARLAAEQKAAKLEETNASIVREHTLLASMGDLFVDKKAVLALIDSGAYGVKIEKDPETGEFLVREKGIIKQNPSLENMTLQEFFPEFAGKYSYLAAGDTKSGTNANASRSTAASSKEPRTKADLKDMTKRLKWLETHSMQEFEALPLK